VLILEQLQVLMGFTFLSFSLSRGSLLSLSTGFSFLNIEQVLLAGKTLHPGELELALEGNMTDHCRLMLKVALQMIASANDCII
jgi:hypothetical protein